MITVFFGHRDVDYTRFREKLKSIIEQIVAYDNAAQFYVGHRGAFDKLCAQVLSEIKARFPNIGIHLIIAYPKENIILPKPFDDYIYPLKKPVHPRAAIIEANKRIVEKCDFVISGVMRDSGGAVIAVNYAKELNKRIISII